MRARIADAEGFVEHGGVKIHYEVYGEGGPTILLHADVDDHPQAVLEGADPLPGPPPPRGRSTTGRATAAPTGRSTRRRTTSEAQVALRARGPRRDRHRPGRRGRAVQGRELGAGAGGRARRPRAAARSSSARRSPLGATPCERGPRTPASTAGARPGAVPGAARRRGPARALGEVQPRVLAATHYEDFLWFFFGQCFPEPHSTKPIEDGVGWGLRDRRGEVLVAESQASRPDAGDDRGVVRARSPARSWSIHGDDDRISPLRRSEVIAELTGGELVVLDGRRAHPAGPRPGAGQPAASTSSPSGSGRPRRTGAGPGRRWNHRPKRVLYLSSPIGLGHARRDLAIARELRERHPDVADRLARPSTRSPGCSSDAGERVHPASRLAGQRVRAHRERGRRARPALLRGAAPDGRDPASRTSWSSTTSSRDGAVRPRRRRRGLGRRPLPAREPGAEAVRVRLADRLRRLPADARRRASARRWSRPTTTPR